jgi:hypothetical protein
MTSRWQGRLARAALLPALIPLTFVTSGCGFSFCVGSGCDSGTIEFGSDIQQSKSGGALSIVGKTDTFRPGQRIAMLAYLSEQAGTRTLALDVTSKHSHRSVPYRIADAKDNEIGTVFSRSDLNVLGITTPGTYTFRVLHGSKELAKGSMTEM